MQFKLLEAIIVYIVSLILTCGLVWLALDLYVKIREHKFFTGKDKIILDK